MKTGLTFLDSSLSHQSLVGVLCFLDNRLLVKLQRLGPAAQSPVQNGRSPESGGVRRRRIPLIGSLVVLQGDREVLEIVVDFSHVEGGVVDLVTGRVPADHLAELAERRPQRLLILEHWQGPGIPLDLDGLGIQLVGRRDLLARLEIRGYFEDVPVLWDSVQRRQLITGPGHLLMVPAAVIILDEGFQAALVGLALRGHLLDEVDLF